MKCRVCGKEIGDDERFCRHCGAEQKVKRKRLSWGERKRKYESENAEFIAKASLSAEQVDSAARESGSALTFKPLGEVSKFTGKNIAIMIAYAALFVLALAALVVLRFVEMNDTLVVVVAFIVLCVAAGGAAGFAERLYAVRAMLAMKKSGRGIKKVRYGKDPVVFCDGNAYLLCAATACPDCGAGRHIEEFEGKMILVCNADRSHVFVLNNDEVFALVKGEKYEPEAQSEAEAEQSEQGQDEDGAQV